MAARRRKPIDTRKESRTAVNAAKKKAAKQGKRPSVEIDTREKDRILQLIMRDMQQGTWCPGYSHAKMMARYAVGYDAVKKWAAEASRFIRLCYGSEEEIKEEHLRGVRAIWYANIEDPGAHVVTLRAIELSAKLNGLLSKEAPEHEVETSLEELRTILVANGYEVTEPPTKGEISNGSSEEDRGVSPPRIETTGD